ncbi:hypothetical protein P7K49_019545 [Saguinus oedipus]|uniref:Uncharacterized protein n=1 Tax=Saguinus oedipus TaxID=9490 RepID=A0ABQ9UXT7_SAGOE|nr:hypothetical protein P7K49_019545 [Saguinus oedipus]
MADPDSRYPCSSIEDDFNYGSNVASASVHIRMGRAATSRDYEEHSLSSGPSFPGDQRTGALLRESGEALPPFLPRGCGTAPDPGGLRLLPVRPGAPAGAAV